MTITALLVALSVLAGAGTDPTADERFIPLEGLSIEAPSEPSDAHSLALRHFTGELARFTGKPCPVTWGSVTTGPALLTGNQSSLKALFNEHAWQSKVSDADLQNQSYVIDVIDRGGSPALVAGGLGVGADARGSLGLGYALADLLRRLDLRDGRWGFVLPPTPVVASPACPNRVFYQMNSDNASPGLSLEHFTQAEMERYVDFLVDARYSRVTFFEWRVFYLYPGANEERRPRNLAVHRAMRQFLDYARRRGLEAYQMVTPSHVDVSPFLPDPKFRATTTNPGKDTGFFFYESCCWSQPEARDLARRMMRTEMEYYGPLDGYTVWFWDPGGCLCADCVAHQAERILDQLLTIKDLATITSPNARFEAVLWPTWAFPNYHDYGIPFTKESAEQVARDFTRLALEHFAPRALTIVDGGEDGFTNLFNGVVDPVSFPRDAFIYRVMGQQGECCYPFALFRVRYMAGIADTLKKNSIEAATFFTIYNTSNRPSVFAFADLLYESAPTPSDTLLRYAALNAKGPAQARYVELLEALEDLVEAKPIDRNTSLEKDFGNTPYEIRDRAVRHAERAWDALKDEPLFFDDRDWLAGFVPAQRAYLEMARAQDEAAFTTWYDKLKTTTAAIPMYRAFAEKSLSRGLCVRHHLAPYWRGPSNDARTLGLPAGE